VLYIFITVRHFVSTEINLQNRRYFSRFYQATEGERETGVEGQRRALEEQRPPRACFRSPEKREPPVLHVK